MPTYVSFTFSDLENNKLSGFLTVKIWNPLIFDKRKEKWWIDQSLRNNINVKSIKILNFWMSSLS